MQLVEQVLRLHWSGLHMLGATPVTDHAALNVTAQKLNAERIERGSNRRDLIEDIDAVTVVGDHLLDAANLTSNALGSRLDFLRRFTIH